MYRTRKRCQVVGPSILGLFMTLVIYIHILKPTGYGLIPFVRISIPLETGPSEGHDNCEFAASFTSLWSVVV